eukprot:NODE_92_length_21543_cov_0.719036.p5 type:complete len:264 gc:universal NODE_92_length_21543_cov_0.719036:9079-8288(-)
MFKTKRTEMNFNSFANKLSSQIELSVQMAKESLGQSQDSTKLPEDFLLLEQQVDALKELITQFIKQVQTEMRSNYSPPVVNSTSPISNIMKNFNTIKEDLIPSIDFTQVVGIATGLFHQHEPLGAALAHIQTFQLQGNTYWSNYFEQIQQQVILPLQTYLNTTMQMVNKGRQNVATSRLHLDACKSRFRSAKPATVDHYRQELEAAEDAFVKSVEDATVLMKSSIEHPETLRCFSEYFHAKKDLLAGLSAGVEKIQPSVTFIY